MDKRRFHAIAGGTILILSGIFLISEHPANYDTAETAEKTETVTAEGKTKFNVFKSYPFWMVIIATLIYNIASNGFTNNAATFYQSIGATAMEASYGISMYSIVAVGWSFIHGFLVDKKGPGIATAVCAAACGAILIRAPFHSGFTGVITIAPFVAALGIAGNVGAVAMPYIYGKEQGSKLMGYTNAAASVSGMVGTLIAAGIFEKLGKYDLFLYFAGAGILLSAVCMIAGCGKKARDAAEKAMAESSAA